MLAVISLLKKSAYTSYVPNLLELIAEWGGWALETAFQTVVALVLLYLHDSAFLIVKCY